MRKDNHQVMPAQYCSNCGYENKFTYKIPEICRACNSPFIEKKSVAKPLRRQPSYREDYEDEDDYYEERPSYQQRSRNESRLKEAFSNAFKKVEGDSINIQRNKINSLSTLVGTSTENVGEFDRAKSNLTELKKHVNKYLKGQDGTEVHPE